MIKAFFTGLFLIMTFNAYMVPDRRMTINTLGQNDFA